MQCKASPIETGFEILEFYADRGTDPVDQADFIVVNDVCVFSNFVDASLNPWNLNSSYPNKVGWFYEGWGGDSLVGFLCKLHRVAHASIKMQEDVLPRYLTPPAEARFKVVDLAYKYGIYSECRKQAGFDALEAQRILRAMAEGS
ncbi:hypothetical protein ASC92_22160 [Variovorax sp. Root411]|nr:hypothetical protein ASC92_22160 [Variovorax sp. Root411]